MASGRSNRELPPTARRLNDVRRLGRQAGLPLGGCARKSGQPQGPRYPRQAPAAGARRRSLGACRQFRRDREAAQYIAGQVRGRQQTDGDRVLQTDAIANLELQQQPGNMELDRALGDVQQHTDFLVGQILQQAVQDFPLPGTQMDVRSSRRAAGGEQLLSAPAHRVEQLSSGHDQHSVVVRRLRVDQTMHGQQAGGFLDRQLTAGGGCNLEADSTRGAFAKYERAWADGTRITGKALDTCILLAPVQKNLAWFASEPDNGALWVTPDRGRFKQSRPTGNKYARFSRKKKCPWSAIPQWCFHLEIAVPAWLTARRAITMPMHDLSGA